MAQLKVKQISDFVSAVASAINSGIGTDVVTGISVAKSESISTAVSADVVVRDAAASDATSKANAALAAAQTYADTAEADAKAHSDTQKNRIDALLLDSNDTLDTFAEIKSFVDGLDTEDVQGLSAAISTGDSTTISSAISRDTVVRDASASDATSKANAAQAAAILSASGDATSKADAAEANATSYAKSYADGLAGNYDVKGDAAAALVSAKAHADQAEIDAVATAATASESYTDGRETSILSVLRGELATVSGTDKLKQKASFVSTTEFSVATAVDTDNNDILVFVNGLQVYKIIGGSGSVGWSVAANGEDFTVRGLGYTLENSDHIIVVGVAN